MLSETILEIFKGKNVLVTGGTGLIGRQVIDILAETGAHIKSVSLDKLCLDTKTHYTISDLTNLDSCIEAVYDMDFVFHLAGVCGTVQTSSKLASHFVPNLMINTNLLEAARLCKVEKLVYTSSIGAYAEGTLLQESDYAIDSIPMSFAGWAKRMAELQIRSYRVQYRIDTFSIVRPAAVYGPGDNFDPDTAMVIPSLMYRIFNGENPVIVWGDGFAVRDFIYSRDCAEGIIQALIYGTNSRFVNLGSGIPCSIWDLVETLKSFLKFDYQFDTTKPRGEPRRVMDISLARETIHYNPTTSLREGLMKTWEWFVANSNEYKNKQNYFIPNND